MNNIVQYQINFKCSNSDQIRYRLNLTGLVHWKASD